jgi:hypothetical protein
MKIILISSGMLDYNGLQAVLKNEDEQILRRLPNYAQASECLKGEVLASDIMHYGAENLCVLITPSFSDVSDAESMTFASLLSIFPVCKGVPTCLTIPIGFHKRFASLAKNYQMVSDALLLADSESGISCEEQPASIDSVPLNLKFCTTWVPDWRTAIKRAHDAQMLK